MFKCKWLQDDLHELFVCHGGGGEGAGGGGGGYSDAVTQNETNPTNPAAYPSTDFSGVYGGGEGGGLGGFGADSGFSPAMAFASLSPDPHDPATYNPVVGFYNPVTSVNYNPNVGFDPDTVYNPATAPPDAIGYPANPGNHGFSPSFGVASNPNADWSTPGISTGFTGVDNPATSNPTTANPTTSNPTGTGNPSGGAPGDNPVGTGEPTGGPDGSGDTRPFIRGWADVFSPTSEFDFRGNSFYVPGIGQEQYRGSDPWASWYGPQGGVNPLGSYLQAGYSGRSGMPADLPSYYGDVGYSPLEAYTDLSNRGHVPEPIYTANFAGGQNNVAVNPGNIHGWNEERRPEIPLMIPEQQWAMWGAGMTPQMPSNDFYPGVSTVSLGPDGQLSDLPDQGIQLTPRQRALLGML